MPRIRLACTDNVASSLLATLKEGIQLNFGCRVSANWIPFDPSFSFDPIRSQYNATQLLDHLEGLVEDPDEKVLGITEQDLFIPILTYVFGEARLNRPPAIISLHRLKPTFYGLPENQGLVAQRCQTEAVHEIGHTFGLVHCVDYACVMHTSRSADEIDIKGTSFCALCATELKEKGVCAPSRELTHPLFNPPGDLS